MFAFEKRKNFRENSIGHIRGGGILFDIYFACSLGTAMDAGHCIIRSSN